MSENKLVDDIIDFNEIILGISARPKVMLSEAEVSLSQKCLTEEAHELATAHDQADYVGCVDAVLDSIYFGVGILHKLGLSADEISQCMSAVHLANMTKKRGINAKRATGAADAIKPSDWVAPEVRIKEILGV